MKWSVGFILLLCIITATLCGRPIKTSARARDMKDAQTREEEMKMLENAERSSGEHHMDTNHGVFQGQSAIIVESSDSESEEAVFHGKRDVNDAKKPWMTCLPRLHPCRKHSQCCEGNCSWRLGMKCDYAFL